MQICNNALHMNNEMVDLAAGDLQNPPNKAAQLCRSFYGVARRDALRLAPWTCVATRRALVVNASAPNLTGRAYAFDLPADFIRKIDVVDTSGTPIDFILEGGRVYADNPDAILVYVPDATDPSAWDALLSDTITALLASKLAYPLSASRENEVAFAQAGQAYAKAADEVSRGERRQGARRSEPWMPGLFPERLP